MIRQRLSVVVVVMLAATVLSGCTPIPDSQLGLRKVDGGLAFVFGLCRGERVGQVFIREAEGENIRMWSGSPRPEAPAVDSIRIFEHLDGWTMDNESLTALEPGVKYDAYLTVGARRSEIRSITLDAVDDLGPGQVLGRGEQGSRATAMSEYDFREAAAQACSA